MLQVLQSHNWLCPYARPQYLVINGLGNGLAPDWCQAIT